VYPRAVGCEYLRFRLRAGRGWQLMPPPLGPSTPPGLLVVLMLS
jgi:hypothetical protein